MSTKEYIYQSDNENYEVAMYQEMSLSDENSNAAIITINNPIDFSVSYQTNTDNTTHGVLSVEIQTEEFDKIAIAWCKHRNLT
ncbi:MAG: hypothetical protein HRU40_02930 [Saprospiraceae bacterium]|nr:hypothetical protein [Saprospiraceae bacterium]